MPITSDGYSKKGGDLEADSRLVTAGNKTRLKKRTSSLLSICCNGRQQWEKSTYSIWMNRGNVLWMPTEYSYFFKGEQKRLEQTKRKGRRISILGLLQPFVSFIYGLVVGSFNGERYITMMDEQARQAQQQFEETGRIRVIVQDNSPIHTSKLVKTKWAEWESLGLYLFFLPKYC